MQQGADVGGSDHIVEVKLKKVAAGGRVFVHTCLVVNENIIGDIDQAVLLGSFQLSVSDVIDRLSADVRIKLKKGVDAEATFSALYDAAWNGEPDALARIAGRACTAQEAMLCVAIPTGIEAFDGELAFLVDIGDDQYFCWRVWETRAIKWIRLERSHLLAAYSAALKSIDSKD